MLLILPEQLLGKSDLWEDLVDGWMLLEDGGVVDEGRVFVLGENGFGFHWKVKLLCFWCVSRCNSIGDRKVCRPYRGRRKDFGLLMIWHCF